MKDQYLCAHSQRGIGAALRQLVITHLTRAGQWRGGRAATWTRQCQMWRGKISASVYM